MWLWAIVTQPAFSLAFRGHDPWYALNILFVFAGATQLLAWHHRYRLAGMTGGVLLLALMAWPLSVASYGVPGLVLALSLAIFLHNSSFRYRLTAATSFIALMVLNSQHIQEIPVTVVVLAILPTVLLPAAVVSIATSPAAGTENRFMPASFFYLAYAGHRAGQANGTGVSGGSLFPRCQPDNDHGKNCGNIPGIVWPEFSAQRG